MESTEVGTRLFFTRPEGQQRDTATSAALSAVFHLLLILALLFITEKGVQILSGEQGVGTGIGAGPAGGGGGGGRDEQVSLLIPTPAPPVPEEAQLTINTKAPEIKPPEEIKPEQVAVVDSTPKPVANPVPAPPTGGSGGGEGAGTGPGTGPGVGPGSGGGSGGGEGGGIGSGIGPGTGRGKIMTPSPEVLLVPPQAPGKVRGRSVVVRLAVDSTGAVKGADVMPSTGDRKYDDALKRTALGWHFRPARDTNNHPVSVLFDVTFTF